MNFIIRVYLSYEIARASFVTCVTLKLHSICTYRIAHFSINYCVFMRERERERERESEYRSKPGP